MELSKRLQSIADLVNEGSSVCDVGTDHGYLPAFLYLSRKCKKVTATDINQKPLESARANLTRLGADDVKLILCDGLEKITRQDADTVIIAGMGGEVISGIIGRASFLRDSTVSLILQPTTAAKELRIFLGANGFCVDSEQAISENNKIYSVMTAHFTGETYEVSALREVIGILSPDDAQSCQYIQKQYRIAKKCADDLQNVSHKQDEYKRHLKLQHELKNILGG